MPVTSSDLTTLTIVVGGTLLATVLRCGWHDTSATLATLVRVLTGHARFDAESVRAHLARHIQEIVRDGLLRTSPRRMGDAEFDEALDVLVGQRSLAAMNASLERSRLHRQAPAEAAIRTLAQAAELAPVFGLAGTLVSLTRLPTNGIDRSAYMAAIAMAVHATLYGLITANLVLAPLGRLVERRATAEEDARRKLTDWLEYELSQAFPARSEFGAKGGAEFAPPLLAPDAEGDAAPPHRRAVA